MARACEGEHASLEPLRGLSRVFHVSIGDRLGLGLGLGCLYVSLTGGSILCRSKNYPKVPAP